ncbi:MAG: glucokinase [Pseudomonadota bacterium]
MRTFLLGDIGATNARFMLAEEPAGDVLAGPDFQGPTMVFPTPEFTQAEDLYAQVLGHFGQVSVDQVVIAAAGPLQDNGSIVITNTGLALEPDEGTHAFAAPLRLVNDFYAVAASLPYLANLDQVGGESNAVGHKAALGPGTGLGMAGLLVQSDGWMVVPSEGGHVSFAPGSHLEAELWGVLSQSHDPVSWESLLSGPGLVNLYAAMCAIWGSKPEPKNAAEITADGMQMLDPVCHQTIETFAGILGNAAGNLALSYLARGGVYLAGGITQKLDGFLQKSPMRRRFDERGPMTDMIKEVPLYIVQDEQPGLLGAYHIARSGEVR